MGPIFSSKKAFPVQNRKNEYHDQIPHFLIILGTKFHLKHTILSFWTNFAVNLPQKTTYFGYEKENVSIRTHLFELVWVPNFNLNRQFCISVPNLPKNGTSGIKQKK